jgi:Electron transfer DM13
MIGALFVLVLFTYPVWRTLFIRPGGTVLFASASPDQRDVLRRMPDRNVAATAYAALLTVEPVPTEAAPVPLPPEAVGILTGKFTVIDAVHRATGVITFYRLPDDSLVLRLEEFEVTNGPGLVLYLSSNAEPEMIADLSGVATEYQIGPLVGSQGDQQFVIPQELNLDPYRSVVIVSEPLGMIYSVAPFR